MANCEKCGKSIADGVVFCDDCSKGGISMKNQPIHSTTEILHDDHELFSFKGKHFFIKDEEANVLEKIKKQIKNI